MTSYYCDPEWHDGDLIAAQYIVKGMRLLPLDRTPDPKHHALWEEAVTGIDAGPAMFCACQSHLEPAVHGMLARFSKVSVLDTGE